MKLRIILVLIFLVTLISIAQTSTFPIQYAILENENNEVCNGEAKYIIELTFENPTDEEVNLLITSYVLSEGDVYTPCEPEHWKRGVVIPPNSRQICRYYYEDLPRSGEIYVSVRFKDKKEFSTLHFTLAISNTTTPTHVLGTEYFNWTKYFEQLNLTLYQVYLNSGIGRFVPYEYFCLILPVFSILAAFLTLLALKRRCSYTYRGHKRRNQTAKRVATIILVVGVIVGLYIFYHDYVFDLSDQFLTLLSKEGVFAYKEHLMSNPETREFKYCYNGHTESITFTVYGGLKEYLSKLPRTSSCSDTDCYFREIVPKVLDEPNQLEEVRKLVELIKSKSPYENEQARIAISLVQMIPYDYDKLFSFGSVWRYPYEVLYDYEGVCMEKSLLLALLLKELGFGVVLLDYEYEDHMAVGIKCPNQYANYIYEGIGYCFVETTVPSIVTDMSGDYIGVGKLVSRPRIIFVSDGISFDASKEYNDAREWQRLNEIADANNGYLNWGDYEKWSMLADKYCITLSQQ